MRSNCIIWAVALLLRRLKKERDRPPAERGRERVYLMVRRSVYGNFPHVLFVRRRPVTGTMQVVSYKPADPRAKKVPPPLFKGYSSWGDL